MGALISSFLFNLEPAVRQQNHFFPFSCFLSPVIFLQSAPITTCFWFVPEWLVIPGFDHAAFPWLLFHGCSLEHQTLHHSIFSIWVFVIRMKSKYFCWRWHNQTVVLPVLSLIVFWIHFNGHGWNCSVVSEWIWMNHNNLHLPAEGRNTHLPTSFCSSGLYEAEAISEEPSQHVVP